jgi:putative transposase
VLAAKILGKSTAFVKHARQQKLGADIVMHDRDAKFSAKFDATLQAAGLRVQKSPYRSPNLMAFVERFIQTLGQECLDHFFIFGERHLNHLCAVFADYYHQRRPHQGKANELLIAQPARKTKPPADAVISLSEVRCQRKLGGLLKHYYRQAA